MQVDIREEDVKHTIAEMYTAAKHEVTSYIEENRVHKSAALQIS